MLPAACKFCDVGIWCAPWKAETPVEYWHPLCGQPSSRWWWKRWSWWPWWSGWWSWTWFWIGQLPWLTVSRWLPRWSSTHTLQWWPPWTCTERCRRNGLPESWQNGWHSASLSFMSTSPSADGKHYLSWLIWSALQQFRYVILLLCWFLLCVPANGDVFIFFATVSCFRNLYKLFLLLFDT